MINYSGSSTTLWGYPIHLGKYPDILNWCKQTLKFPGFKRIVTINPHIISDCETDPELKKWIQTADLTIPDGNGICWALKKKCNIQQTPLTGIQLTLDLLNDGVSVYLVGAAPTIPEKAATYIARHYPKSVVLGYHHGFMAHGDWEKVAIDIEHKKPDIILVGMGFPKQEYFIQFLSKKLSYGIAIGVGGVIDVLAGEVQWAPVWIRKIKMEWIYRGIKQPKRIKQWGKLIKFIKKVLLSKKSPR